MKNRIILLSAFTLFILGIFSCKKSDDSLKIIELLKPENITETGFIVRWNIQQTDIKSITFEAAFDETLSEINKTVNVADVSQNSLQIDNMNGSTKYFYRITADFSDGSVVNSDIRSVRTGYTSEVVSFYTSDDMEIAAVIGYLSTVDESKPGIIFMHELGAFVNNWKNSEVVLDLIGEGYLCMIMDFRGHGGSTPIDDLWDLVDDKSLVAKDLTAAVEFIKNHNEVDSGKLSLVGASLGAIMAIAGNGFDEVTASVSLSGGSDGIFILFPEMTINSALYIVGDLDIRQNPNVNFPEEAEFMYSISDEPKKLVIVPNTSSHGTDLLTYEYINDEIIDWINSMNQNE